MSAATSDDRQMWSTQEDLEDLLRDLRRFAERWIDGVDRSMPPQLMMLVGNAQGQREYRAASVLCDFNTEREKHGILHKLGRGLYQERKLPIAIGLASEAWSVRRPVGAPRDFILPEDAPDRQEVAILMALGNGGPTARQQERVLQRGVDNSPEITPAELFARLGVEADPDPKPANKD